VFRALVKRWMNSSAYQERTKRREPMDNRLFVRALIVDGCQREATSEEYSRMRSALDGLSDPLPLRAVLARLLLDSDQAVWEKRQAAAPLVQELFLRFLGREPGAAEAATFGAALSSPQGSQRLLAFALVSHPEYQSY
jgi:hypothetical protein